MVYRSYSECRFGLPVRGDKSIRKPDLDNGETLLRSRQMVWTPKNSARSEQDAKTAQWHCLLNPTIRELTSLTDNANDFAHHDVIFSLTPCRTDTFITPDSAKMPSIILVWRLRIYRNRR